MGNGSIERGTSEKLYCNERAWQAHFQPKHAKLLDSDPQYDSTGIIDLNTFTFFKIVIGDGGNEKSE